MYMRYTQGQNAYEEYYPGVCTINQVLILSGLVYVHEVYTGTE